ncbi:MAG: SoxR reducing system RseC family protein [Dehalococcoidia bacterium]|nr:SoxR reducing system RseC family protein [Dehalococcoidia bacterium]
MTDDDRSDRVLMWQTYVQTAENTSTRREAINRYMVPVHLAMMASHFVLPLNELPHIVIGIVGMAVSYLWIALLDAHRKINDAKYDIIIALEEDLPCRPFDMESKSTGIDTGLRKYPPLTQLQNRAAWTVFVVHLLVIVTYALAWTLA